MELQRYWSVVRKRLWLIALIAIVSCTAVGYYTSHYVRPVYQATTKLMVYPNETSDKTVPDAGAINSSILLIKTFKQLIMTPRILDKVVADYPDLHTTKGELGAKIGITSVSETQIMTVVAADASYERAAKLANAVSKVFQQEVRTLMRLDNVSVLSWADPSDRRETASSGTTKNVMIAFVLSLMIGTGIAFLLDHIDDSVKAEHDVRVRLGMSLLADVPKIRRRDLAGPDDRDKTAYRARREKNVTLDA
ncbi:YveK family protein [Cohnella faecalis]|uniref:YveK family protein n=1 Tax=Cohnella faecalis TaxID=2315694 RepID=UPI0013146960|nr:Wzz/FepE/Etk N-terminal domain-containing protein [Cohnella faecalis]